jgi:hypothetical protein
VEKDKQASVALINDTYDRLESAVKASRNRQMEKVTSVHVDIKEAVAAGKAVLLGRKVKLTSHKQIVERAQSLRSWSATDLAASLEARVKALDNTTTLPKEVKTIQSFTFTVDMKSVADVEKTLSKLWQLEVKCSQFSTQAVSPSQQASSSLSSPSQQTSSSLSSPGVPAFRFHSNHGSKVVLSNNQLTAEFKGGQNKWSNGTVIGCDPMQVNMLYEVSLPVYIIVCVL